MFTALTQRFARQALVAAVAALCLPLISRAEWVVTTADFKETKYTINEFSLKDGASVSATDGALTKIPTKELLAFVSDRTKTNMKSPWSLTLRNGDVMTGAPADSEGDNITFTVAEGVDISVPIKDAAYLLAANASAPRSATTTDVVTLANKDKIEGVVSTIKGDQLTVVAGDKESKVTLKGDKISVTFAGITPPRTIPDLCARITFLSGSTVTVSDIAWRVNDITFKDPAGTQRKITTDKILSIEIIGGRSVFLTELDPVSDTQTTTFGTNWPMQVNKNVMGQPMKMAKQTFARGIGVHTASALVYQLDGTFEQLTLRAGIDDSAIPYGQADLSILLDGKVLWEKKSVKAGTVTETLNLPIKGGRKLELRAAQSEKLDVQGRVNWVNIALTR